MFSILKKSSFVLLAAFLPLLLPAQTPVKKLPQKGKLNLLVHPADQLVCEGMPVVFRAFAACPAPEVPQYQWQSSVDGLHWDDIPGATASAYEGIGLARRPHNASQFRVKVSGAGESAFSFPAQLLVESGVYFTKKPEKQSVPEGGTVIFEASAESESGNGVASYQWQMSPYASGVWMAVSGENLPVLKLENVNASMNGNSYRLLARSFGNCDSTFSAPAFLIVEGRPVVSITPLRQSLCGGGQATFSVQIQGGNGREIFQWQRAKAPSGPFEDLPGEQSFSLKINNIDAKMDGWQYRSAVTLADGSKVTTQVGRLEVHGSVSFSKNPQAMTVCAGEAARFEVGASFQGKTPAYRWQFSTDGGGSWQDLADKREAVFDINFTTPELHGRLFRAAAESGLCGTVFSESAKLSVITDPRFRRHPRDVAVKMPGDEAVFTAEFEAQPGADYGLTWEWSGNGGSTWQFMPGGSGTTLRISRTTPDMAENLYRMKIFDKKCGRISYSEAARVLLP